MNAYELTILVDACQQSGTPGTVYLIEPDPIDANTLNANPARMEAHGMNPMNALRMVKSMGGVTGRVMIVGCEPAELGSDEGGKLGLSDAVLAGVDEAIAVIESLISKILQSGPVEVTQSY
jgi:hydrogenase maturation protease